MTDRKEVLEGVMDAAGPSRLEAIAALAEGTVATEADAVGMAAGTVVAEEDAVGMAVGTEHTEKQSTELAAKTSDEVDEDEQSLIIRFKKPYIFEKKEYTEIDLSGLDDLQASDMIAVNKYMERTAKGIQVMPEVSLEYACVFASRATKLPIEFFMGLPPKQAMKVKDRVLGFLFGSD